MKKLFLLLALVGTIFSACEGGGDVEEENGGGTPSIPKIELAKQSIEVEFEPAEYSVDVTSPYSWEATTKNSWIKIKTATGIAGTKTLKFSVTRNEEEEIREGTITLKNADYNLVTELYVTQKAFIPIIECPESLTFAFEGGTQDVIITANIEYEVKSDADWLTIEKGENGISATVPNYAEVDERTVEITISNEKYGISKTVKVSQGAFVPELTISPETLNFAFEGDTQEVVITANFEYEYSSNVDWLSTKKINGGLLKVTAIKHIGEEPRTAEITISNEKYGVSKVVKVSQGAFVPELTISPETLSFAVESGEQEIAITANFEYEYSANVDWVSFKKTTVGISVVVPGNVSFESRTAEITLSNEKYGLTQSVSVSQNGITAELTNIIFYTYSEGETVTPYKTDVFGANIVSNAFSNGEGAIIFDAPVTSIGEQAFYRCSSLTSVTIPNSVTSIGNSAFWNCDHLTSVTIPDSVTSIGEYAFYGCNSLTSVTIGNSVTSIGDASFAFCDSLTSVYISDLSAWCKIDFTNSDSNPLYNGAKLYLNNTEVTELTIPSDITKIKDAAFRGCSSLTSVTIPDSVTSIGSYAFYSCSSLTSVTIPDNVTSIGSDAFEFCSSLTSVTIGNSVTSIGSSAFYSCSSLTSLTIPDSVTSIGSSAFGFCSSLTSVTIPDSVTEIGQWAFNGCSALTSVKIGNGVTSIGKSAFYGCTGELIVNCNIPSVSSSSDDVFDGSKFTKVTIGNSVTSIGKDAFSYCSSLTSVTIGNGVTSIGHFAFEGCSSLTSVTIGNSVTSIGEYAFNGCRRLTSVYCKAVTPPTGGSQMFSYYHHDHGTYYPIGCKIYVPRSSVSAYKSYKYGWSSYYDYIVGYDF